MYKSLYTLSYVCIILTIHNTKGETKMSKSDYPVENLTNLEQRVLSAIAAEGMVGYCTDLADIKKRTGMELASIKGVVGSLVKKGLVAAEEDHRNGRVCHDLFLRIDGECLCFGDESGNLTESGLDLAKAIANYF